MNLKYEMFLAHHFEFEFVHRSLARYLFSKKNAFLKYFDKNEILNEHSSKTDTHHLLRGIK